MLFRSGIASNDEHRRIMEAVKAGRAEEAERLATLHMENAYDNIVNSGLYDIFKAEDNAEKKEGKIEN